MPRISTDNYDTVASWNGSQDLFIVEQPDGTKVATPAMVKQYVLGNSIDDIYSVMGQMGAKNLIPYPYYETTKEVNGVVITDNGDGTITINGTASTNTTVFRYLSNDAAIEIPLERRKYKLTFGTDQGSSGFHLGDYRVVKTDSTTQTINVTGDTIIDNTNGDYIGINAMSVYVAKDKTVNNVTIYPMLRLAADTDDTYQPYAKTNRQLTEVIGDLSQTGLTGDSVAEQLDTAREQISDKVQCGVYTSPVKTVQSKQHDAITFSANFPSTVFAAAIMNTINAAYVFANVIKITPTEVQVGVYNDYTNALSGAFTIIYFYK